VATEWLLIDGSSLIFRAFYGVPRTIRSPAGMQTNAIRGFLDYLVWMLPERGPRKLVVATDEDWRPQWRVDLIHSYKSHRTAEPVPPELIPQMTVINEVMAAIGIAVVGKPDYEAEDIIATVAAQAEGRVEIISGDRDLFALVRDPDVVVLYPEGPGRLTTVDESYIAAKYGIPGRNYADFAILRGDPSDGLPGLSGVGQKKAAGLVQRYGSVEEIAEKVGLSETDAEYLRRARRVVTPVPDIPLEVPDSRLPVTPKNPSRLAELGAEHGIKSPVDRLVSTLARMSERRDAPKL
jgi:5'-3' exonuclease